MKYVPNARLCRLCMICMVLYRSGRYFLPARYLLPSTFIQIFFMIVKATEIQYSKHSNEIPQTNTDDKYRITNCSRAFSGCCDSGLDSLSLSGMMEYSGFGVF